MARFSATPYEHDHENEVILFGSTNFRNQNRKFGIKTDDRRRHMYVIGKTGMGKTTLLENMVLADVYAGHGLAYIDPHGDTAEKLLDFIPPHRINDVVYFNPADMEFPIGFNILETVDESQKHLVAAGLMGVFKKIWPDVWSSRMEYILLNTIMALLDFPGSTLLGINRLLSDAEYRKRVVSLIQDPVVKTFWVKEFAAFSEKYRTEAVAPLQNKVGQFLSATIIRNIVAQVKSTIDIREIMDTRKIFIVNLSKGRIGEENSRLLGAMIITRLQLAAMERVDMPEKDRQDFYLYVDEFQNFATESFANILSEARKYRLNLIVAHQYIEQLDEMVRAAIFGNVGTLIAFRVGAADAAFMENEFMPRFTPEDLVNLKKFEIYLKLMIDGAASAPFSAATLPPIAQRTGTIERVVRVSRERYAVTRKTIEEKVIKWSGFGTADTGEVLKSEEELEIEQRMKELEASSPDVGEMAQPADGGGFGSKKKKEAQFKIPCSVCGKISELTFEPDWSKPWFCKEHLELKQKGQLPKVVLPPRPKPVAPVLSGPVVQVGDEAKPVPLSALRERPPEQAPPRRPQRDDRQPKGERGKDRQDRGQRKGDKPKRPEIADLVPVDGTVIPMQSHKPRIVIGGGEDREVLQQEPKEKQPSPDAGREAQDAGPRTAGERAPEAGVSSGQDEGKKNAGQQAVNRPTGGGQPTEPKREEARPAAEQQRPQERRPEREERKPRHEGGRDGRRGEGDRRERREGGEARRPPEAKRGPQQPPAVPSDDARRERPKTADAERPPAPPPERGGQDRPSGGDAPKGSADAAPPRPPSGPGQQGPLKPGQVIKF